jgi:hypothetical protein
MYPLPAQALPEVPHIIFGIFNLAIPNIIAWGLVVGVFAFAVWARIPRLFEPPAEQEEDK